MRRHERKMNMSLIKSWTGGDAILCRAPAHAIFQRSEIKENELSEFGKLVFSLLKQINKFALIGKDVFPMLDREDIFFKGFICEAGLGIYRSVDKVFCGTCLDREIVRGHLIMSNGNHFEGSFDKTEMKHGKLWYSKGETFEGWFKNNKPFSGDFFWPSYERYSGEFLNGVPHGKGIKTFPDGSLSDGIWENNVMVRGIKKYSQGDTYEGEFKGNNRHGNGKYTWANGDVYNGEWKDNRMNGVGRKDMMDGSFVEGEFRNNMLEGFGKKVYPSGEYYLGFFKDDNRHGRGSYHWVQTGERFEGEWAFGDRVFGLQTFPDKTIEGKWVNEKKQGEHIVTFSDGKREIWTFENSDCIGTKPFEGPEPEKKEEKRIQVGDCCVCMAQPASHVYVPCGHLCVCQFCGDQSKKKCPMCKSEVFLLVKVYVKE